MFVIGRNVEAKVEGGQVTIVCQLKDVVPTKVLYDSRMVLATTPGAVLIPRTNLRLNVCLFRFQGE
ncbi:hypothetical protein ES703_64966 [subsurface metagenome]